MALSAYTNVGSHTSFGMGGIDGGAAGVFCAAVGNHRLATRPLR